MSIMLKMMVTMLIYLVPETSFCRYGIFRDICRPKSSSMELCMLAQALAANRMPHVTACPYCYSDMSFTSLMLMP